MGYFLKDLRELFVTVLPPFIMAAAFKLLNLKLFDLEDIYPFPIALVLLGELAVMLWLGRVISESRIVPTVKLDRRLVIVLYYVFPVINAVVSIISLTA